MQKQMPLKLAEAVVGDRGSLRVAMVAGEASGDLLAGMLLHGMRKHWPGLLALGIGGPRMAEQGFHSWWPHDKLSVHGFSLELLVRLREILGIRDQLRHRLLQDPPALFIGVDAPDFNLALESALRKHGVRTIHFVCPSVWAWRAERMDKIRQSADHVLCLFPFEPALLERHGIAATYVGHPLAHAIPEQPDRALARAQLGIDADADLVALLPGSRSSEVRHLAARFLKAAKIMQRMRPGVRFIVPVAHGMEQHIQPIMRSMGLNHQVQWVAGQSHTVLAACDVALVASGTATLEAALFKRPMVIAYHMAWWSWFLMKRKRLQPWAGLPNILSGEFIVPELLQEAATPEALAQATVQWFEWRDASDPRWDTVIQRFSTLHDDLRRDTIQLTCDAIEKVLQG